LNVHTISPPTFPFGIYKQVIMHFKPNLST